MATRQDNPPSSLQLAVADYAWQQVKERGRSIPEILAQLRQGRSGLPTLTRPQLEAWMRSSAPQDAIEDPFGGERDETRRAERLEQRIAKAAETIPGAAELIGIDRFVEDEPEPERRALMVEVVRRMLDFLVPELVRDEVRYVNSRIAIPPGWAWECWDDGSCRVSASVLAMTNAEGNLARLRLRTRPIAKPYLDSRGYSTYLPIRYATLAIQADKEGVAQRLIQYAQEFRASRHGRMTQSELAAGCGRSKQAISHQRLLMWDRVQESSGGRAVSPGLRNLGLRPVG